MAIIIPMMVTHCMDVPGVGHKPSSRSTHIPTKVAATPQRSGLCTSTKVSELTGMYGIVCIVR